MDNILAYTMLRITLGINLLMHGLVRMLGNYSGFVETIHKDFQNTFLPSFALTVFGWSLPPIETLVGLLLIIGLFTRFAALLGFFLIWILIFGSSLVQNWNVIGIEMIYGLFYYFIINHLSANQYSFDKIIYDRN